jgi:4-hydroxy-3-methylbut-2-en-1-yl diphosphate reductase
MKQFEVPTFYRSPILSKIKAQRKVEDPRKKDFTPTVLQIGELTFLIARHFGFCYGVENAIERSYKALQENPGKRIFLLSQMIHNPAVNEDLIANGIQFLQDTQGNQLIPFSTLRSDDIVLIPAFGTTLAIEQQLKDLGLDIHTYNTTCPFVEKVWNRSEKLGETAHTIIIHGKHDHEETRATFSHATANGPALIIKNMQEAQFLAHVIKGVQTHEAFFDYFEGKMSKGFDPQKDLQKIGVVNQTTMLATETQEITDYLRSCYVALYGDSNIKNHIADTRDTLCYATNDNQSATLGLLAQDADFAVVVGGYNSSNTSHLVELLEQKFTTYYIKDTTEITPNHIQHFNFHTKQMQQTAHFFPSKKNVRIVLTSGASCPDSIVENVMNKLLQMRYSEQEISTLLANFS